MFFRIVATSSPYVAPYGQKFADSFDARSMQVACQEGKVMQLRRELRAGEPIDSIGSPFHLVHSCLYGAHQFGTRSASSIVVNHPGLLSPDTHIHLHT